MGGGLGAALLGLVLSDPGLAATMVAKLLPVVGRNVVEPALKTEGLDALDVHARQGHASHP